jgi:hypothetical protein
MLRIGELRLSGTVSEQLGVEHVDPVEHRPGLDVVLALHDVRRDTAG